VCAAELDSDTRTVEVCLCVSLFVCMCVCVCVCVLSGPFAPVAELDALPIVTLLLHYCHTVVTLLLRCCYFLDPLPLCHQGASGNELRDIQLSSSPFLDSTTATP
jgi:hypothetical protein